MNKKYNKAISCMFPGGNYCYGFDYDYMMGGWRRADKKMRQDKKWRSTGARRRLDQAVIQEQLEKYDNDTNTYQS